jgi:hypothetical protein
VGGRSRSVGAILVACVVVLGTACAGDDASDPQATDTPDAASDDAEPLGPEAEVEAAYLAHWEMLDRLSEVPDPDDPEIAELTTGQARIEVVQGLTALLEREHVARLGPAYAHSVISIDLADDSAVVRDCVVDDSAIVHEATGEKVRGGERVVELLEVTLVFEEERWKVSVVDRIPTEGGVESCED